MPGSTRQWVTSMVASVGPYKLCSWARLRRTNRAATGAGSVSPLHRTSRREVCSSTRAIRRYASSMLGTKWQAVICSALISRSIWPASRWAASAANTQRPPLTIGT